MIIELIFKSIFGIFKFFLSLIPSFDFISIPQDVFDTFNHIVCLVSYFVPVKDLAIVFTSFIAFTNFRFIYSIVMRLWDALPFT